MVKHQGSQHWQFGYLREKPKVPPLIRKVNNDAEEKQRPGWYSRLIRHLLQALKHNTAALKEAGNNTSKPKRCLGKTAFVGHCFMAVSKRLKKGTKMKDQHIL